MISERTVAPAKDGSLLLQPAASDIPEAIRQNDEIFKNFSFKVRDLSAKEFRAETRKELLSMAKGYTSSLFENQTATWFKSGSIDTKIIQTGHQPGFFHPGIMVKYSLLGLISRQVGGIGVNLAVDNDTPESTGFNIPSPLTPDVIRGVDLFHEKAKPLEYLNAPLKEDLDTFLSTVEKNLASPLFAAVRSNFLLWKEGLRSFPDKNLCSATDFLVIARRLFLQEQESHSLDLPVSLLSASDMFFRFFLHIAGNAGEFMRIYNSELSEYRTGHKVRYPANPFPNLKKTGEAIELPFWFFDRMKRKPLFVKTVKGEKVLLSEESVLSVIPDLCDASALFTLFRDQIRPKAIPLTLFNRLFFSDIFIHGTGGSKYDSITDGIIRKFFNTSPPVYITASITRFPNIRIVSNRERIEHIENSIRDITFNPDRYITDSNDDIKRKHALLNEIKKPGADRKTIGMEIKQINAKLLPEVIAVKQKLMAELSELKEEEKKYEAFMRRDFPFFLFKPEDVLNPVKVLFT